VVAAAACGEGWHHRAAHTIDVDGVSFGFRYKGTSTVDRFHIHKPGGLLERYVELMGDVAGRNVVELGIHQGGSAALAALVGRPRRMVVVDIGDPVPALDQLVADRGLPLRPYYGVDQADQAALARILEDEFGDEPLDLVVDDASHLLVPTRASFEVLFPRLRPGGQYLIEDWDWELRQAAGFAEKARSDPAWGRALVAQVADPDHELHGPAASALAGIDDPELRGILGDYEPVDSGYRPLSAIVGDLAAAHFLPS